MVGMDVLAYCPKCKKERYYNIGHTNLIRYKNKKMYTINCYHCGTKFAGETKEYTNNTYNLFRQIKDNTKTYLISNLENELEKYNDKTPEDTIEKELFEYSKTLLGEKTKDLEYEIKYIIQLLMSNKFNTPNSKLESFIYDDIKEEAEIIATYCY